MTEALSQWWNTANAMSELFSGMFLVIFVGLTQFFVVSRNNTNKFFKWFLTPLCYALAGMVSIYIGFGVGLAIDNDHFPTALMSIAFALVKCIYWNAYQFLIVAIAFQMIGSMIGLLSIVFISKVFKRDIKQGLVLPSGNGPKFLTKEVIFQVMFILVLLYTTSQGYGMEVRPSIFFGVFISTIGVHILFTLSTSNFYFMLSPNVIIANLVLGGMYKVVKLENITTAATQFAIQSSVAFAIGIPEYLLRT